MPINVRNLSFTYDKKAAFSKDALLDVSLDVEKGDFFAIAGRTGSGKSTLISHLNGLIDVQSGSVTVDGIELKGKYDRKKLRARVGMVFQYPEYQLFAETVKEDVAFGPRNIGVSEEETASRVRESIELVGLDYEEIKNRSPFELSGGQMRRVAFAGIIAMRPEILVLDEPTAGLDPAGKKDVMNLISRLKQNMEAVIIVSHNMNEVAAYCNKIAVLSDGKLKGVFAPKELFSDPQKTLECGLELPDAAALSEKLRQNGLSVSYGAIDEKSLVSEILRLKGGKL